jgi:hypothetical protein
VLEAEPLMMAASDVVQQRLTESTNRTTTIWSMQLLLLRVVILEYV